MFYKPKKDSNGNLTLEVDKRGQDLIHNPLLNKGTAFSMEERKQLGLVGLLPPHVSTIDMQLVRMKGNFDAKRSGISHYIALRALQDRNETLFYAFLRKYIAETLPIVYTPTVGEAVEKHGHIYRNARGIFISTENVDKMDEIAQNLRTRDIEIIVVTDSQGILGIGDQGVGGMAIPIGKLSLYTVGAGIHPSACLPICLDVGTDNQLLLDDPLYLGIRQRRITGSEYSDFIKKFVDGVKRNFPNAILQWEDFSKQNAFNNMDGYSHEHPSFNDDIQGTGAVVLAGLICAMKIKKEKLSDQSFAIYGAGAAGIGIARQLRSGLLQDGLSKEEAQDRIFVVDSQGLITSDRHELEEYKRDFAKADSVTGRWLRDHVHTLSLKEVIKNAKITALIGVSGQPGSFDKEVLELMLKNTEEPIILPLSNPTSKAEADPREILKSTGGAAIVSSGSPFDPVTVSGKEYRIGQGNNAFIFPGLGLGAVISKAKVIKDSLFTAAAQALAEQVSESDLSNRRIYPPVEELYDVSFHVAKAVYEKALEEGVGTAISGGDTDNSIRESMWIPEYPKYSAEKS